MDILDIAIERAGSVGKLADQLGVRQNVVSNWRARGLPRPWRLALELKYGVKSGGKASRPHPKAEQRAA